MRPRGGVPPAGLGRRRPDPRGELHAAPREVRSGTSSHCPVFGLGRIRPGWGVPCRGAFRQAPRGGARDRPSPAGALLRRRLPSDLRAGRWPPGETGMALGTFGAREPVLRGRMARDRRSRALSSPAAVALSRAPRSAGSAGTSRGPRARATGFHGRQHPRPGLPGRGSLRTVRVALPGVHARCRGRSGPFGAGDAGGERPPVPRGRSGRPRRQEALERAAISARFSSESGALALPTGPYRRDAVPPGAADRWEGLGSIPRREGGPLQSLWLRRGVNGGCYQGSKHTAWAGGSSPRRPSSVRWRSSGAPSAQRW